MLDQNNQYSNYFTCENDLRPANNSRNIVWMKTFKILNLASMNLLPVTLFLTSPLFVC